MTDESSRIPTLEDLGDVTGRRVLVRTDFNVPLEERAGRRSLSMIFVFVLVPTISWLLERGAQVVCASHLGRPKGQPVDEYRWIGACTAERTAPGVELLENLRFNPGEGANDDAFVGSLTDGIISMSTMRSVRRIALMRQSLVRRNRRLPQWAPVAARGRSVDGVEISRSDRLLRCLAGQKSPTSWALLRRCYRWLMNL